jgi:hypothetical protein
MKNQKIKIAVLAIAILLGFNSFAKTGDDPVYKRSVQFSVNSYINQIKFGKSAELSKILADNVKFNMSRNGKIYTHGKKEELALFAENKDIIQQCKVEQSVIITTKNYTLVKVSSVYQNFIREDYITLVKSKDNWRITDVTTDFK